MRTVARTALALAAAGAVTLVVACGEDSTPKDSKDRSLSSALTSARDGDYSDAICSVAYVFSDASENAQDRARSVGKQVVSMAEGTEWAESGDNSKYIDLGDDLFSASVDMDEVRNGSLRSSIDTLC